MSRKDECLESIKTAVSGAGKELDEKQARQILETLGDMKDLAESSGNFEDFRTSSMNYLRSVKEATLLQKVSRARQSLSMTQNNAFMARWTGKLGTGSVADGIASRMFKSPANVEGVGLNVESISRSLRNDYNKAFHTTLEVKGLHEMAKNKEFELQVAKELFEIQSGRGGGGTNSKHALEIAKVITGVQRRIVRDLRASGFYVNDLMARITQQTHDPASLKKVGKDAWISKVLEIGLDEKKTFSNFANPTQKQKTEFLAAAFDDIVLGRMETTDKQDILNDIALVGRDVILGNKFSGKRNIHFKDGEAFHNYNQEFGKRCNFESVQSEIDSASRSIALARVFGPDAQGSFDSMMMRTERMLKEESVLTKDETNLKAFQNQRGRLEDMFKGISGPQNVAGKGLLAKSMDGYRSAWRMANLGMSAITNLADLSAHAANLSSSTGKNLFQSHLEVMSENLNMILNPKMKKEVASGVHLFMDDAQMAHLARVGGDPDASGRVASAERMFFKMTGLPYQQYNFKMASANLFARELHKATITPYAKLDERMKSGLKKYNIGEAELALLKDSGTELKGHMHIYPEAVERITGNQKLSQQISQFITDNAELVGDPSEGLKYGFWGAGNSNENTYIGQVLRMVGVMKTFPQHMQHVATKMVLNDPNVHAANLSGAYKTKSGAMSASKMLAGYMASAATMTYIAWSMKEFAKGKTPPDPKDPDTWKKVILSSGVGGIYADLIQSQDYNKDSSKGIAKTIAGPILSEAIFDIPDMYDRAVKSKGKSLKRDALSFGVRHTPGNNLPLVKPTIDYLFLNEVMEANSPGYLRKRESALEKQGQSYWAPKVNKQFGRGE
jgi:hypothetical protein